MLKINKNKDLPLVSIIIPCFNSEQYISECIESIFSQDYSNIEIIAVDDGSTDNSLKILQNYSNIRVYTQINSGACIARNLGLAKSKGKYIKFLDSDDKLEADAIKNQVETSEKLDDNTIVYGNFKLLKNNRTKTVKNVNLSDTNQIASLILNSILTSTPLHRRILLEKSGGFDERLKSGQEWNLHIRLASLGCKFYYCSDNIFQYRIHDSTDRITNKRLSSGDLEYGIYKLELTRESIKEHLNDEINAAFSLSYWKIARAFYRNGELRKSQMCLENAKRLTPNYKKFWNPSYLLLYTFLGFENIEKALKPIYAIKKNKFI